MRRLLRILLNAATVLSLLLCVATVAVWVRSYFACDAVTLSRFVRHTAPEDMAESDDVYRTLEAVVSRGHTRFEWGQQYVQGPFTLNAVEWDFGGMPADIAPGGTGFLQTLGFEGYRTNAGRSGFEAPIWPFACAAAVLPVARLVRRLRLRLMQRAGVCPACGYDLRATPDRCPECGRKTGDEVAR